MGSTLAAAPNPGRSILTCGITRLPTPDLCATTCLQAAGVTLGAIRSITDNNVAPTPSPIPMPGELH